MNDDCQVPMARYTGDVYSTVLDIKRQLLSLAQISSKVSGQQMRRDGTRPGSGTRCAW